MIDIAELDPEVITYIAKLRQEAARYRNQRNGARDEAEALRTELAALRGV
jgi:hypothetical protein